MILSDLLSHFTNDRKSLNLTRKVKKMYIIKTKEKLSLSDMVHVFF